MVPKYLLIHKVCAFTRIDGLSLIESNAKFDLGLSSSFVPIACTANANSKKNTGSYAFLSNFQNCSGIRKRYFSVRLVFGFVESFDLATISSGMYYRTLARSSIRALISYCLTSIYQTLHQQVISILMQLFLQSHHEVWHSDQLWARYSKIRHLDSRLTRA